MDMQEKAKLMSDIKTANSRLRRLEEKDQRRQSVAYRHVNKNFDKKYSDIMELDRHGQIKFKSVDKVEDEKNVGKLQKAVEDFLKAKTSTTQGVLKSEQKRNRTLERKYGKQAVENINNMLERHDNSLLKQYDSDSIMRMYAKSEDTKALEKYIDKMQNENDEIEANKMYAELERVANDDTKLIEEVTKKVKPSFKERLKHFYNSTKATSKKVQKKTSKIGSFVRRLFRK